MPQRVERSEIDRAAEYSKRIASAVRFFYAF